MRLTNLERTKARGLGIGSLGPCLGVNFCGPDVVRCRGEAWAPSEQHLHPIATEDPPEAAEPTAEIEATSLLLGVGQVCHLRAPETSLCQSQKKRSATTASGLWQVPHPIGLKGA